MKTLYPPNDLKPVTWEQIKEFYKEHWNEDLKEDWKEAFCFAWSQSRSMKVIDLLASGFRAAQHRSKVMNSPEKLDSCEHIVDVSKMVDVNYSRWISVKERLPEDGQRVLLYNSLEYVSIVMAHWYSSSQRPFFDHVTIDDIHMTLALEDNKHLYWQPLPKPPKED